MSLQNFRKNIRSQFGEDGIIEEIFSRIGTGTKICIEFGAWDGEHCSNVWNLWHNSDWTAVLIEADSDRFIELQEKTRAFSKMRLVNKFVEPSGANSIDAILQSQGITQVDLLSIDIDGNDYYILDSLHISPRVIIIEFNPTIPPGLEIVQEKGGYFGASATSILRLAKSKGYKLAAITNTNLILVGDRDFNRLGFSELDLAKDFLADQLVYVITSYDGKAYLSKPLSYKPKLQSSMQFLNNSFSMPRILRKIVNRFVKPKNDSRHPVSTDQKIIPVKIVVD